MPRWPRFTWFNNPFTWLLGLALGLLLSLLLLNLVFGTELTEGMPNQVLLDPAPSGTGDRAAMAQLLTRDSVTLRATEAFSATPAQRVLYGRAYRDAWGAAVTVPVLRLDSFAGGLRPVKRGGGFQTLSLDLVDSSGTVYTMRSVAKDPGKLVPGWAPYLGITNIVTDGTSAGHPYGAAAGATLAELAGIPHMHPALYFVPMQARLDTLNASFGGRLFWLEYEPDGRQAAWLNLPNFQRWLDSDDVFAAWRADSLSAKPALRALVRARLFDIWVGDWDRHDGQWGWAETLDSASGRKTYTPVPNDRDNIFYGISGAIPLTIAAFERRLRPFGAEVDDIRGVTKNSAPFDGAFLYGVPETVFIEEAQNLQLILTDAGIERAMHVWPPSVYALDGERIAEDLKARRAHLVEYARRFHKVIQARGPSKTVENEF